MFFISPPSVWIQDM